MADKNKIAPLDTLTMQELFENIYCTNASVIKDLLYPGTYIFAGAPKIGKSFFVVQLACMIYFPRQKRVQKEHML